MSNEKAAVAEPAVSTARDDAWIQGNSAVMDQVFEKLNLPKALGGQAGTSTAKAADAGGKKEKVDSAKSKVDSAAAAAAAQPAAEPEPTAEEKAAAELAERAKANNWTAEEQQAFEALEAEEAQNALAERAKAANRTPEEQAQFEQEEASAAEAMEAGQPEFTAEQQAYLEGQRSEQAAAVQALESTKTELEAKVASLTQELQRAGTRPVEIAAVDPLLAEDDLAKIAEVEATLHNFERWALKNWDGTEAVPATATSPEIPAFPKEAIRERYALMRERREKIVPLARQAVEQRKAMQGLAQKAYPNMFKAGTPDNNAMQNVIALMPGLKAALPNWQLVIGDALVGERIRLAREKTKLPAKAGVPNTAAAIATRKAAAPPPAARGGPSAGPGATATAARKAAGANKGQPSKEKIEAFAKSGGSRNALVSMLQGVDLLEATNLNPQRGWS